MKLTRQLFSLSQHSYRLTPSSSFSTFSHQRANQSDTYSAISHKFSRGFKTSTTLLQDHYQVLGVSKNATQQEIKSAFRELAKKYHPDMNKGNKDMEQKFKEVSNAYRVLSDEQARKKYDLFGEQGAEGDFGDMGDMNMGDMNAEDLGDLFNSFFGGAAPGFRPPGAPKRQDVVLKLSFMEAVKGCNKQVEYQMMQPCGTCHGKGQDPSEPIVNCSTCNGKKRHTRVRGNVQFSTVCGTCNGKGFRVTKSCGTCKGKGETHQNVKETVQLPAGVSDGESYQLSPRSQVRLLISVAEDELFRREGDDIHVVVPLTLKEAMLGAKVAVPTLSGPHQVQVRERTASGEIMTLRSKGVNGGDLVVHFQIALPKKLSDKQRQLVEEFGRDEVPISPREYAKQNPQRFGKREKEQQQKSQQEGFFSGFSFFG